MPRQRAKKAPRRRSRGMPVIATIEQTALATADTVTNVTLFAPPSSTTSVLESFQFTLRSCDVTITAGNTSARVYAIVRKVPSGYTAPSITVSNAISTFADVPNVLAYGIINVYASDPDPMNRISLNLLRNSCSMISGDSVIIQVVSDTSSVNQAWSSLAEYHVSG